MRKMIDNLDIMAWELSPDGKTLAFKTFKRLIPGTFTRIFDLHVMPSEGGPSLLLMEDVEDKILWSPDSSQIAFVSYRLLPKQ